MSTNKNKQSSDDQEKPAEQTAPEAPSSEDRQGSGASNLTYDFRIVPVDPKNSFDFEDVADK